MSFTEAIKDGFDHYTVFDGRASRPAYWWWFLFAVLVSVGANIVAAATGLDFLVYLVALAMFLPGISVGIRRLHDTGRSGWWLLIGLIPIVGFIVLIIFFVSEGDAAENEYGPPPAATLTA